MFNSIYIKEAFTCLKANKLRSFLALLGLLIGTASVVALITIATLAKNTALEQFKNLGTQKILLHLNNNSNNKTIDPSIFNNNLFNNKLIADYSLITSFFKSSYYNEHSISAYNIGATHNLQALLKIRIKNGRFISDYDTQRNFAVIGSEIVEQIKNNKQNPANIKVGDYLFIDGHSFIIIGILDYWPVDPLFSYNINRSIIVPISTAQYLSGNSITEVYFNVNEQISPTIAENHLKNLLNNILPGSKFQFSNAEQIINQLEKQAGILTILLGTIGAISLLVGAIGVMNIMLVSITERRSEIGLRMAIGANPNEIKLQFLYETMTLALLGGLLGTAIGILIPYIIAYFAEWTFSLPVFSLILGITVSLGVGVISGLYPAVKASQMLPVNCLNSN